jgi:ribokinase
MSMTDAAAPHLVCCGNLTLDDLVLPDGTEQKACIGGDALYGVLAARLFLQEAQMLAPVGCDLPASVWSMIEEAGLSRDGMPARGCPTIRTHFAYATDDRRVATLLSSETDFGILSPRAVDVPAQYWAARAFMVLAMTLDAQRDLVAALRARGGIAIGLDTQDEYIDGNESAILDLVGQVDVFMPSADEVRLLIGDREPAEAAQFFAALGPRIVVIKLGAAGCLVHNARSGTSFTRPPCPGPVVDTTGAGDAFCSGFMASLVQWPDDLDRAAAAGAVAARFAVAGFGAGALFAAARRKQFFFEKKNHCCPVKSQIDSTGCQ